MVFGLSLALFTMLHVAISLVAIIAGLLFFVLLLGGRWFGGVNLTFLLFTILTSVTGFMFPPRPIGPPFIFGVVSLILLAVAVFALFARGASGKWRAVYLAAALMAQWLNMVVLVVQSFQKVPALHALAPNGNEPVVLAAQAVVVAILGLAGWRLVVVAPQRC